MKKQITKQEARKLYERGKWVYLLPCKLDINDKDNEPELIFKAAPISHKFDTVVNLYSSKYGSSCTTKSRCSKENGYYYKYYITVKEQK